MVPSNITPRNKECEFKLAELFFSITDDKGIIEFGNEVFTRISGYATEELLGAPHNIIRHPDMPRAVFQLLWDYIEAGKTVAAYVKNMAKDGSYYWVVALVMPCNGSYLSIRLKPSSPLFPVVQEIYADMLKIEKSIETEARRRKEAIQAGTERLQELLTAKGFATYDEFMWLALRTEMTQREAALQSTHNGTAAALLGGSTAASNGHSSTAHHKLETAGACCVELEAHLSEIFTKLDSLVVLNEQLIPKSEFVLDLADSIHLLSLNAEIGSRRLGDMESGRTLSVVAEKMGRQTETNADILIALNKQMTSLAAPLGQLLFNIAAAKLQVEMTSLFVGDLLACGEEEDGGDTLVWRNSSLMDNVGLLVDTSVERLALVFPVLEKLATDLQQIKLQTSLIQKFVHNLRFIHFLGQVEAARTVEGADFRHIFEEVMEQAQEGEKEMGEFASIIASNMSLMGEMQQLEKKITASVETLRLELCQIQDPNASGAASAYLSSTANAY